MSKQFGFDLRVARRGSGFRQSDVAHLLGISQNTLSDLEKGIYRPSLENICALSIIFDTTFEHHVAQVLDETRDHLQTRLASFPPSTGDEADVLAREESLQAIERRLSDQSLGDEIS